MLNIDESGDFSSVVCSIHISTRGRMTPSNGQDSLVTVFMSAGPYLFVSGKVNIVTVCPHIFFFFFFWFFILFFFGGANTKSRYTEAVK